MYDFLKKNILKDTMIFFGIFVIVLIFKYKTLNDPFYWDDMGGIITPALNILDNGLRLILPYRNFGHPLLMQLSLVGVWKIFGFSVFISHLFILFIGSIGLFYTYKIGSSYFNRYVGMGSAILLFFNQLFFSQIGTLNDSIPLLTLSTITVYYYLQNKKGLTFLFSTLLILTKETGAIILAGLFIHYLITSITSNKILINSEKIYIKIVAYLKKILKESWFITMPLIPLFVWLIFLKLNLGWALRTDLIYHQHDFISNFFTNLSRYFYFDFSNRNVNNANFILLFPLLLAVLLEFKKVIKKIYLFLIIILLYSALFSYTDDLPRYFTILMPFFYLITCWSIYQITKKSKNNNVLYFSIILICVVFFNLNYYGERQGQPGWILDSNLEYRDAIFASKNAVNYIENNYSDKTIITYWPLTDQLADPRNGYVKNKIKNVVDITEYKREQYLINPTILDENYILSLKDAVYYYSFPTYGMLEKITKNHRLNILKKFEINNKAAILFQIAN